MHLFLKLLLALLALPLCAQVFQAVPVAAPGTNPQWRVTLSPQGALTRSFWKHKPKTELIGFDACTSGALSLTLPLALIRRAAAVAGRSVLTAVSQAQAIKDATQNGVVQLGLDGMADLGQAGTGLMAIGTIHAGTVIGGALVAAQAIAPIVRNRLTPRLPDMAGVQKLLIQGPVLIPGSGSVGIEGCVSDLLLIGYYTGQWLPERLLCVGSVCHLEDP